SDEAHDEYDRLRRRLLWKMPSGLYVVGTTDRGDRRNGMTMNWATQISFDPKWIGISVESSAFTHELIEASGVLRSTWSTARTARSCASSRSRSRSTSRPRR